MSAPTSLLTRAAATWGVESPEYLALSAVVDAAALGARTLEATLDAAGYQAGSCTDEWTPSIRAAVAALPVINVALAQADAPVQATRTPALSIFQPPSTGMVIDMANEAFSDQPRRSRGRVDNDLFYLRVANALYASQADGRKAALEVINQVKRDAQLVPVLLSYINDGLSTFDKSRLVTELDARGLTDHDEKRRAALSGIEGLPQQQS